MRPVAHTRISASLVVAMLTIAPLGTLAATTAAPPISVSGSTVDVPALERTNRVFVPVRGLFEKLGAKVTFTSPSSIVARKNGHDLANLAIGSRTATVNGASESLDVAPFMAQGRAMVPLRLISEAAGASVTYVASPRAVQIAQRSAAAAPAAVAAADTATAAATAEAVATTAPVAATAAPEEQHGIPWWVWLLAALILLGLLFAFLRRKKEPVIVTSSKGHGGDPNITTRH